MIVDERIGYCAFGVRAGLNVGQQTDLGLIATAFVATFLLSSLLWAHFLPFGI